MEFNPIQKFDYIKKEFNEYVISTFHLKNDKYQSDFIDQINGTELSKGPYLKLDLPFIRKDTINQLIDKRQLNSSFRKLSNVEFSQAMYEHQTDAINKIAKEDSVVITTGTGSGKTESFLFPIYNSLLQKIEKEGKINGIHAIILYPLNALVNDQLERIRGHLSKLPEITYGIYTGDTKEEYYNYEKNFKDRSSYVNAMAKQGIFIPENEKIVRAEIKQSPPNILITNYSMLEYLLVRPLDNSVINKDTMSNWQFMVLDEAHTYRGTTATEVAYLVRRLTLLAEHKPQFILTSATLGSGHDDAGEIAKFAEKLTSQKFNSDDIIFASRFNIGHFGDKYNVDFEDYIAINDCIDDDIKVKAIIDKYNPGASLYDFLFNDKMIKFIAVVLDKTKSFDRFYNYLHDIVYLQSKEQLIALINVINHHKASKNGAKIYSIKYHFFVTTLEGAFVTLDPSPALRLTKREVIDDLTAFEIGTCKYCSQTYLIGRIYNNQLVQSDAEINDELESFEDPNLAFFLPENELDKTVDIDENDLVKYIICSKCGHIRLSAQIDHQVCNCGSHYENVIYKIESQSIMKNNISVCPVCQMSSNKSGVVRTFSIGKDQSTALLAQISYNSLSFNRNNSVTKASMGLSGINLFNPVINRQIQKLDNAQILTFSDSRQQASFFALFLQNNQDKFLRKALVLEAIKSRKDLSVGQLANIIERLIKDNKLFAHDSSVDLTHLKQAYATLLFEIYKEDGVYSLEGLGLAAVNINVEETLTKIDEEMLKNSLPLVNVTHLPTLANIIFNGFRIAPAIDITESGININERQAIFQYRSYERNFILRKQPKAKLLSSNSFLPVNSNIDNSVTDYLRRTYNLSSDEAVDYATKLWTLFVNTSVLKSRPKGGEQMQIDLGSFTISDAKYVQWYVCDKCKTITFNNIHDTCVTNGCVGRLHACIPEKDFEGNYYRKGYLEKRIEPFVAQEHTAQLSREEAKIIAEEFKAGKINLLSTSTTFEMGINMGDLDMVFLRNIPPTPANYIQRAGRAGRGKRGVGMIITYANNKSHDQMYFQSPEEMIEGVVKVPVFTLANRKILFRHIVAFTIGIFYRNNPNFLIQGKTKLMAFIIDLLPIYLDYVTANRDSIEKSIKSILDDETKLIFNFDEWLLELKSSDGLLMMAVDSVNEELNLLEFLFDDAKKNFKNSDDLRKQIELMKNQEIINGLAKNNVIPSYGFPINVVELKIYDPQNFLEDKKYNLTRELSVAISEYAPGSEVIVNKRKFKSRYVRFLQNRTLPKRYCYRCTNVNCDHSYVSPSSSDNACPLCNSPVTHACFIEPIFGFMSNEEVKHGPLKPIRFYDTNSFYLGKKEGVSGGKNYVIKHTKDDEILIINEVGILLCEQCGYSVKPETAYLQIKKQPHKTIKGTACGNEVLNRMRLGHIIKTDVIKLIINLKLTTNECNSVLYALINGISKYMQIEDMNIDGSIFEVNGTTTIILYDTTYGGSGNVKKLSDTKELLNVIDSSIESVSHNCCDIDSSCSKCLRTYRNNHLHSSLQRSAALAGLDKIKNIILN